MAGIGFELKKLFSRRGLLATLRAYGYAGIVCTGPMILGVVLLLGVTFIAEKAGLDRGDRELLVSMITYALLASLTLTSLFSMLTTRCTADMLYMERAEAVMPSFYGSLTVMLVIGVVGYGVFLHVSGIPLLYQVLSLLLFASLVVVWTEINYLTAIKDYRNILLAFFVSERFHQIEKFFHLFAPIAHFFHFRNPAQTFVKGDALLFGKEGHFFHRRIANAPLWHIDDPL